MGKSIQLKDSDGNIYPITKPYTIVSNSNGYAYKFEDGLMITVLKFTYTLSIASGWGNVFISGEFYTPYYPVKFKEPPIVTMSLEGSSDGAWIMNGDTAGTVERPCNIRLVRGASLTTNKAFVINIIAIGRWK